MEKSIPAQLSMFGPTTSADSANGIFSPELASGPTRLAGLAGQTTDRLPAEVARVRRSPPRAKNNHALDARREYSFRMLDELASSYAAHAATNGLPTSATYGRKCGESSAIFDRQSSLENKLRALTANIGSRLFELRWKSLDMLFGQPICRLRGSARRTFDNGYGSWPTTTAVDGHRGDKPARPWDTGKPLPQIAALVHWPTTKASDGSGGRTTKTKGGGNSHLDITVRLTGWGTPRVTTNGGNGNASRAARARLEDQVQLTVSPWATPSARDWKDSPGMATTAVNPDGSERTRLDQLPRQASLTASGPMPNGSLAATEKRGQLSPAFSLWLMALPSDWALAAPSKASRVSACSKARATRSSRKRPSRS